MKSILLRTVSVLAAVFFFSVVVSPLPAATITKSKPFTEPRDKSPYPSLQVGVHKVGQVNLTVTNYGIIGTQGDPTVRDPETGLPAPSCEYPAGTDVQYLFQGALWIGAIVDEDTLVSTGHDGWQQIFEMYADAAPAGNMIKRSTRPNDPAYSPSAISEADYIATYYDTLTDPSYVQPNPYDGRPHIPLGVRIRQESYSWSQQTYEDFVLFNYRVTNIDTHLLRKLYFGLYFDGDAFHAATPNGFQDDISGSRDFPDPAAGDSLFVAWTADNDGDPSYSGTWDQYSARAVIGISVIDFPVLPSQSFAWWVSNGDPVLDWAPRLLVNNRDFGTGGSGTPEGDRNKYYVMSRPERDYDQLFSAVDHQAQGWLPPSPVVGADVADGYDTKFLLSFGALDLAPGDSFDFAVVVAMGDNFHQNPGDFHNLFDPQNPQAFCNSLDFSDLETNVLAARNLYRSIFLIPGDANYSHDVNLSDAVFLVGYIFLNGAKPYKPQLADANGDCVIDIADVVYLVQYIFADGAAPVTGCAR